LIRGDRPVHNVVVFGFGPAEIFLLICLGLIFAGREKLPEFGELLRSRLRRDADQTRPREWNAPQWLVVGGILAIATFLIALFVVRG
jgi:hypothetical protein